MSASAFRSGSERVFSLAASVPNGLLSLRQESEENPQKPIDTVGNSLYHNLNGPAPSIHSAEEHLTMLNSFSRTELLLGHPAMEALKHARVAVFGIGGVGGYACEALVRSGVGAFDLIDDDKVCLTNINRQIIATRKTVGQYKADVMRDRMLDINPQADIRVHRCFFLPENAAEFLFSEYDYILDAVDTVSAKLSLAVQAQAAGVPIISAMGRATSSTAAASASPISPETRVCPLARVMRRELQSAA